MKKSLLCTLLLFCQMSAVPSENVSLSASQERWESQLCKIKKLCAKDDECKSCLKEIEITHNINTPSWNGFTLLSLALIHGNQELAETLLDLEGIDLTLTDPNENTVLHQAVSSGCCLLVGKILSKQRDLLEKKNKDGQTPLLSAAQADSTECFLELRLAGADLEAVDKKGRNALLSAAAAEAKEITSILLDEALENRNREILEKKDEDGQNILFYLVSSKGFSHGEKDGLITDILKTGSKEKLLDGNGRGRSILYEAALSGDVQLFNRFRELVLHRVNTRVSLTDTNINGSNLLIPAVLSGNVEMLQELLETGLFDDQKKLVKNVYGNGLLQMAVSSGSLEMFEFVKNMKAQKENDFDREEQGRPLFDATERSRDGSTLLHRAVFCGKPEMVKAVLKLNAVDIQAENGGGWTPLQNAIARGNVEIVDLLLNEGADVNAGRVHPLLVALGGEGRARRNGKDPRPYRRVVERLLAASTLRMERDPRTHRTFLQEAVRLGAFDSVEVLMNDVFRNPDKYTLDDGGTLLTEVLKGASPEVGSQENWDNILECLIRDKEIDPNTPNANGETPLSIACEQGLARVVRGLLSYPQIDVNSGCCAHHKEKCCTPLHTACLYGQVEIVKLLLNHPKIDPSILTRNSRSRMAEQPALFNIFNIRVEGPHLMRLQEAEQSAIFDAFCQSPHEALIEVHDAYGRNILHMAAVHGGPGIIEKIWESGKVNVNERFTGEDGKTYTPFLCALKSARFEAIDWFLARRDLEFDEQEAKEVADMSWKRRHLAVPLWLEDGIKRRNEERGSREE